MTTIAADPPNQKSYPVPKMYDRSPDGVLTVFLQHLSRSSKAEVLPTLTAKGMAAIDIGEARSIMLASI